MRIPIPAWLYHMWPPFQRRAVIADYAAIGQQHRYFLADLALRGGVFRAYDQKSDGDLANFNGRRELALEVFKFCKVDPERLYASIPETPSKDRAA